MNIPTVNKDQVTDLPSLFYDENTRKILASYVTLSGGGGTESVIGPTGPKGDTGSKGETGNPGERGPQGERGPTGLSLSAAFGDVNPSGNTYPPESVNSQPYVSTGALYINTNERSTWLYTGTAWLKVCPSTSGDPNPPPTSNLTLEITGVRVHLPTESATIPFNAVQSELNKPIVGYPINDYAYCGFSMFPVPIEFGTISVHQPNGGFEVMLTQLPNPDVGQTASIHVQTAECPQFIQTTGSSKQYTANLTSYNQIKILQPGTYTARVENFPQYQDLAIQFTQDNTVNPAPGETVVNNKINNNTSTGTDTNSPIHQLTFTEYMSADTVFPNLGAFCYNVTYQKRVNLNNETKRTPSSWTDQNVTFTCNGPIDFPNAKIIIEKVA